jgi:hypothetical protein
MFRTLLGGALVAATALAPLATAHADESGAQGRIVRFTINAAGSDDSASVLGTIGVRKPDGKIELYQWGGTSCPASKLEDWQVLALEHAFHNRHRTLVTPRYKVGDVKDLRCLVGFELSASG